MANRKISTDAVEKFKTSATTLVTEVDDFFTTCKTAAENIDRIAEECELNATEVATYFKDSPTTAMDSSLSGIKKGLDDALEKAQSNDQILKGKMSERSAEMIQLKGIISQYRSQVEGAASISPSLVSQLSTIGINNNIDKIPGVSEGRKKRVEHEMKWNSGVLTDEEIIKAINENYRNLSGEDLEALLKYYRIMNTPQLVRNIASYGKTPQLIIENGKYVVAFLKKDAPYIDGIMTGQIKAEFDIPGGLSAEQGFEKGFNPSVSVDTGIGGSFSASGSTIKGNVGDTSWSGGNIDISASASTDGVGINAGANLASVTIPIIIREDDLYRYGAELSVSLVSAEISADLSFEGIELGAGAGLIGINISGGRTELIDINVDM